MVKNFPYLKRGENNAKKKGEEKDINVKFPEEYHAEDLRGKDAVFAIKLHEIKKKELPALKRFVLPGLGIIGSAFMVFAALYSHGYAPYIAAKEAGQGFTCPVLFYLIVFAVIMSIGMALMNGNKAKK